MDQHLVLSHLELNASIRENRVANCNNLCETDFIQSQAMRQDIETSSCVSIGHSGLVTLGRGCCSDVTEKRDVMWQQRMRTVTRKQTHCSSLVKFLGTVLVFGPQTIAISLHYSEHMFTVNIRSFHDNYLKEEYGKLRSHSFATSRYPWSICFLIHRNTSLTCIE